MNTNKYDIEYLYQQFITNTKINIHALNKPAQKLAKLFFYIGYLNAIHFLKKLKNENQINVEKLYHNNMKKIHHYIDTFSLNLSDEDKET